MNATQSGAETEVLRGKQEHRLAGLLADLKSADEAVSDLETRRLELVKDLRIIDAEVETAHEAVDVSKTALARAEAEAEFQETQFGQTPKAAVESVRQARLDLGVAEERRAERLGILRREKAGREGTRDALDVSLERAQAERERARQTLQELQDQRRREEAEALKADLKSMAPVVEAQREALGASGAVELAAEYEARADQHQVHGRAWLTALASTVIGVIAAVIVLFALNSAGARASTSEIVTHVSVNIVVLGMLVFVARVASLQFRAQRHMEEVARNKSAALRTFNRIVVASPEPEVRSAIATVLAQNVFASTDTGLLSDSSSDQVTIVERMVAPLSQRSS